MRRLFALLLSLAVCASQAQELDDEAWRQPLRDAEALLARPLPAAGSERLDLLDAQTQAARQLAQRGLQVQLSRQLVDEGRNDSRWAQWLRNYLSYEFIWGRSQQALDACEAWIADDGLPLGLRATVALRQSYMRGAEGDQFRMQIEFARAQRLVQAFGQRAPANSAERYLRVELLQVRSELERLQGRLQAATATLREALLLAEKIDASTPQDPDDAAGWLDGLRGMLVYALVRQGRAAEGLLLADEQLRRWERRDPQALKLLSEPRWRYRRAHALNALQRHAEALADAESALRQFGIGQVASASHTGHLAMAEQVRALLGLRRWVEADAAYQAHLAAVAGDRVASGRARNPALVAVLAAQAGRLDEALEAAERSLRYRERLYGADHPLTQEMAGVRGFVRLARGERSGARSDFERLFVAVLDRPGGWLDLDQRGLRGFVLGLVFDTLLRWVAQDPQPPALWLERALQIADRLKLGSTQRALVDASSRLRANDPQLAAALEREQQLRQQAEDGFEALQAAYHAEDQARRRLGTPEHKALAAEARERERQLHAEAKAQSAQAQLAARTARQALEAEREAIARQFPAYAELVSPSLPRSQELARWLQPGEGLLIVHAIEPATLVWLIRTGQSLAFRALPLGEAALAEQVGAWRAQLDLSERLDAPQDWAQLAAGAHALHQALIAPLSTELREVNSLIVASSGPLAQLPLGALLRQPWQAGQAPAWLLRDMALTQLPAAASLQVLRQRRAEGGVAPKPLLAYGDPLFGGDAGSRNSAARASAKPAAKPVAGQRLLAPRPAARALRWDEQRGLRYGEMPALPDTRAELQAIARQLGAGPEALRLGAAATRRDLLAAPLVDYRVLALATHGLLPGELPGLSQPALALAADGDQPPLLELEDVLGLRLRAERVLLSACNSAAAQGGDQAMSGLVRGFFFAGARAVIATHWAVESASAAQLAAASFAADAGSRAEALRRAQLQMADGSEARWRHPYYWAGYALFGDPRL